MSEGKISENKIKLSHFLFYAFLILMFFAKGIGLYDGQTIYRLLFWFAMLCAAGKIALTGYTKKQWIVVILLGILAVLIERHSGEKGVLICYAIVVGMKDISLKRVMQIGAAVYGITMCGMVTYFGIFLEKSTAMPGVRFGIGKTLRYALGYPHPNNLLMTYLATITMLIYCLGKKYNWKYAIALMVGNLYLFSYCMSYTGIITSSLMILLPLYLKNIRHNNLGIFEYSVAGAALPLCLLYSFGMPYLLFDRIADFLSNYVYTLYHRLILAKQYMTLENLSLLGTHASKVVTGKYSIDNSFLYAFVFNGVIFFLIVMALYAYMIYQMIKEKRNLEVIIICVFLLEGIIEPLLFNTSFKNITLFFLGEILWKRAENIQGYFDSITFSIPGFVEEVSGKFLRCWEKYVNTIVIVSVGAGIVISVVCAIRNTERMVFAENVRSCIAVASGITILVGIILYLGFYFKERYTKKK